MLRTFDDVLSDAQAWASVQGGEEQERVAVLAAQHEGHRRRGELAEKELEWLHTEECHCRFFGREIKLGYRSRCASWVHCYAHQLSEQRIVEKTCWATWVADVCNDVCFRVQTQLITMIRPETRDVAAFAEPCDTLCKSTIFGIWKESIRHVVHKGVPKYSLRGGECLGVAVDDSVDGSSLDFIAAMSNNVGVFNMDELRRSVRLAATHPDADEAADAIQEPESSSLTSALRKPRRRLDPGWKRKPAPPRRPRRVYPSVAPPCEKSEEESSFEMSSLLRAALAPHDSIEEPSITSSIKPWTTTRTPVQRARVFIAPIMRMPVATPQNLAFIKVSKPWSRPAQLRVVGNDEVQREKGRLGLRVREYEKQQQLRSRGVIPVRRSFASTTESSFVGIIA